MERQIKFRAWNEADQTMGEPFTLQTAIGSRLHNGIQTDGVVYMQFTGLTDKNGKEIYEGDIIQINRSHNMFPINQLEGSFNVEVKYQEVMFYPLYIVGGDCEIVGNIYENPEMV